jgi:hypothetical protein
MPLVDIALATGHSELLVREYLDLIEQFQLPPLANAVEADSAQAGPTSMPNGAKRLPGNTIPGFQPVPVSAFPILNKLTLFIQSNSQA